MRGRNIKEIRRGRVGSETQIPEESTVVRVLGLEVIG